MRYWPDIPTWQFYLADDPECCRYVVKVQASVEQPTVDASSADDFLNVSTLVNQAGKVIGYSFDFSTEPTPEIADFGFSLAASYGKPDTTEVMLVLGSPHLRAIRAGAGCPTYQIVLRRK